MHITPLWLISILPFLVLSLYDILLCTYLLLTASSVPLLLQFMQSKVTFLSSVRLLLQLVILHCCRTNTHRCHTTSSVQRSSMHLYHPPLDSHVHIAHLLSCGAHALKAEYARYFKMMAHKQLYLGLPLYPFPVHAGVFQFAIIQLCMRTP